MGNHYIGQVSFKLARERLLAASDYWRVTDQPEDKSMLAQFNTKGDEWSGFSLYYNNSEDELVKSENEPQPFVWVGLEGTIGSTFEDIHGSGMPWYRLTFRVPEETYQGLVVNMIEHLGDKWLDPVAPYLTVAEYHLIGERERQLDALYEQGPPMSYGVSDYLGGIARDSVEVERTNPRTEPWVPQYNQEVADRIQAILADEKAQRAEHQACSPSRPAVPPARLCEDLGERCEALDQDDFIKRLKTI